MQAAEMRSFSVMRHLQVCVLAIFAVLGLTFSEEHIWNFLFLIFLATRQLILRIDLLKVCNLSDVLTRPLGYIKNSFATSLNWADGHKY